MARLFSYRARQKVSTRLKTPQPACLRFILIAFCSHNVTYCTQCHICCSNTATVPIWSLKLLWQGLTRLSYTIVNLKKRRSVCVSQRILLRLWQHQLYKNLDLNLPFSQSGLSSAASSELPLGTVRKVGQGQHMTAAHCYTTLESNSLSLFLSFATSHLVSVSLTHTLWNSG